MVPLQAAVLQERAVSTTSCSKRSELSTGLDQCRPVAQACWGDDACDSEHSGIGLCNLCYSQADCTWQLTAQCQE